VQSERKNIYLAHVKHLLEQGKAYPCFCTSEELEASRTKQESLKIRPGYYGEWAVHRSDGIEDIRKNLAEGKSFVVRLRSEGNWDNKFRFTDEIKGTVAVTENDQDIVILKSEGLPTYHFAHVVDDHLMGTTHVLRGDEWLSSLPVHLQMFRMLGWPAPKYGHMSPIMKNDAGAKRKLSKRKDPEAAIKYYLTEGYPNDAVMEYLLNIANSDFEDWRKANPDAPHANFVLKLNKLSKSGALFDLNKLIDISKNVISRMTAQQVYDMTLAWATAYDADFARRLADQKDYFVQIFNIERGGAKPRKDFSKWSEVKESVSYFFDDQFDASSLKSSDALPAHIERSYVAEVLRAYADRLANGAFPASRDEWFDDLKRFAVERGFADDMRAYKADPSAFRGSVADIAMMLRVALTGRTQTPDLFEMISVMTVDRVAGRLKAVADL
jgi:glutamyl-tRNA synthetase